MTTTTSDIYGKHNDYFNKGNKMVSRALQRLSRETGRVSIPTYVYEFLSENDDRITDFRSAHKLMLETLPDSDKVPTLNETLLYYNIYNLQKIADLQLEAITYNENEMKKLDPGMEGSKILRHKTNIERLERRYQDIAKELMKYSDSGIDRETPKQLNVQVNHLDLNSIHQQIREMKDVTPKD